MTSGVGRGRSWRTAIAQLSDKVKVDCIPTKSFEEAQAGDLAVSRVGTIAAANVTTTSAEPFVAVSMYGLWESLHSATTGTWIYADASVHRLISDLSALVGRQAGHRIVAAGDLNVLYGYGEHGSAYWAARYATVFSRMSALGLEFVGPQAPNGRSAVARPAELPHASKNVPTYHTSHESPARASRQVDFVFASRDMAGHVGVKALNEVEEWGPSDHCRIEIEIA